MSYDFSAVLIVPAPLREAGNALAEAIGLGPGNFSIPLSYTGQEPATHFGLSTWADAGFEPLIDAAGQGVLPDIIADAFDPEQIAALIGAMLPPVDAEHKRIVTLDPESDHFGKVLKEQGLTRIDVGEQI